MAKIFLATIGTRGEVQPVLALALELKSRGHHVKICAPPNFQKWIESFGIPAIPIGPDVRKFSTRRTDGKKFKITREQARAMVKASIDDQFRVLGEAAKGSDLVFVGGGLQTGARSVAEANKIPYIYAAYCACTLPAPNHPPPRIRTQRLPRFVNRYLWRAHDRSWSRLFGPPLNFHRQALGLEPIGNVPRHVFTDHPWLAADPVVSPGASTRGLQIVQTGAWFLDDSTALPDSLEKFLANGEPPIYFGFGSTVSAALNAKSLIDAARKLGRRSIVSQGWADLEVSDPGDDCISIGDVNHQRLFSRVAAIVHHGGAGTTTAAARAGVPQLIVPHNYDQYYFAHRINRLGIGTSLRDARHLDIDRLTVALRTSLNPETRSNAQALAGRVELRGASIAAEKIEQILTGKRS